MREKRIKFTPHSEETIIKLLEMHDAGVRSKDIYKQSKDVFGFTIKQSTISNILARNGRNAKENTYRVKRHYHPTTKKTVAEITTYKSPIDGEDYPINDYPRPEGASPADQLTIDLKKKALAKKNGQPLYNDYIPRNSELSVDKPDSDFENPQDDEDFEPEDLEEYEEESED